MIFHDVNFRLFINVCYVNFQASVSVKRINKYMNLHELSEDREITKDEKEEHAVKIEKASYRWGIDDEPTLKSIDLNIKKKSLTAIVGTVGSGKSSLMSAILGIFSDYFDTETADLPQFWRLKKSSETATRKCMPDRLQYTFGSDKSRQLRLIIILFNQLYTFKVQIWLHSSLLSFTLFDHIFSCCGFPICHA